MLEECCTQMKTLIRERDDELNGKVKGALVQTRRDCDQAYNQMLDVIEAAALMADDATPYQEFITRWNTALTRYIQQIISKKGTTTGGSAPTNPTNPTPDGGGSGDGGSGNDTGGSSDDTGSGSDSGGGDDDTGGDYNPIDTGN